MDSFYDDDDHDMFETHSTFIPEAEKEEIVEMETPTGEIIEVVRAKKKKSKYLPGERLLKKLNKDRKTSDASVVKKNNSKRIERHMDAVIEGLCSL